MLVLRRVFAFLIDFFFWAQIFGVICVGLVMSVLSRIIPAGMEGVGAFLALAAFLLGMAASLAVPTAKWGATPGKWLFRLEVIGPRAQRLSLRDAMKRELVKLLILFVVMLGWFISLVYLLRYNTTFHDYMVGSQVVPRVRLTETQKRFLQAKRRYRS